MDEINLLYSLVESSLPEELFVGSGIMKSDIKDECEKRYGEFLETYGPAAYEIDFMVEGENISREISEMFMKLLIEEKERKIQKDVITLADDVVETAKVISSEICKNNDSIYSKVMNEVDTLCSNIFGNLSYAGNLEVDETNKKEMTEMDKLDSDEWSESSESLDYSSSYESETAESMDSTDDTCSLPPLPPLPLMSSLPEISEEQDDFSDSEEVIFIGEDNRKKTQDELAELMEKCDIQSSMLFKREKDYQSVSAELAKASTTIQNLFNQGNKISEDLYKSQIECESTKAKFLELQQSMQELEKQCDQQSSMMFKKEKEYQDLANECVRLSTKMSQREKEYEQTFANMNEVIREHSLRKNELNHLLAAKDEDHAKVVDSMNVMINNLSERLNEALLSTFNHEADFKRMNKNLSEKDQIIANLSLELANTSSKNKTLVKEQRQFESIVQQYSEECARQRNETYDKKREVEDMKELIQRQKDEVRRLHGKLDEVSEKNDNLESEIKKLTADPFDVDAEVIEDFTK